MPDYELKEFKTAATWRLWLEQNHAITDGVQLRIYKKATALQTVTYAEALDEALCYGWIDGTRKSHDEMSFTQKFTPRRTRSLWSKRNVEYIARLTAVGKMTPAGQAEVERAKADGRWDAAYDKPSEMVMPAFFMIELGKHPKAKIFYETLSKTSRFIIAWNLQTAKTEVARVRRCDKFIVMLEAGEKPTS